MLSPPKVMVTVSVHRQLVDFEVDPGGEDFSRDVAETASCSAQAGCPFAPDQERPSVCLDLRQ